MPDEASPSPESSSRSGAGLALAVVALFILLPVLYVLSVGPAVYLARRDYVSREAVHAFYWPLAWLYDSWELIQPLLEWYLNWWR